MGAPGQPYGQPMYGQPAYADPKPFSNLAIAGFVLAFVSGPLILVPVAGYILSLLGTAMGFALSFAGLRESGPRGRKSGWGLALAGVILNAVGFVLLLALFVLVVVVMSQMRRA
jgi:hypothetical protein